MNKVEHRLRNNFIWNSIGNFTYLICQWLITILIVRITDYKKSGVFSLAMSITNAFYSIAAWGIRTYQVSDVDNKYRDNTYIGSRYITCTIAFIACSIFTILNKYSKEQTSVIIIYMIFRSIEAYTDVLHGIDQKAERMDFIGKSFLMRGIAHLFSFTIVLFITKSVLWSVICISISSFGVCVVYDIPKSRKLMSYHNQTSLNEIEKLLIECSPLVLYTFLMTAVSLIPRYFLEKILGNELLGIYASIATPAVIVQAAASYIMAPFITPLAEYVEKKDYQKYITLIKKILSMMGLSFAFVTISAHFLKDIGLKILFNESILQYTNLFMPVIFCTITTAFSWFLNMILTIFRDFKGLLISNLMGTLCCIMISSPLIHITGLNGASVSLLISTIFIILLSLYYLLQNHKKRF